VITSASHKWFGLVDAALRGKEGNKVVSRGEEILNAFLHSKNFSEDTRWTLEREIISVA
jgi:hypothetical protein